MRDLNQAKALLMMASKDFRALKGMMNAELFDGEIFGFHAQQAIEKCLKAWLAYLGKEYPLTHDISVLLGLLEHDSQDVQPFWDLVEYNVFAVRFRYESLDTYDEPLDRQSTVNAIQELIVTVERLFAED
jgi:HEPN domain-containing protein